MVIPIKTLRETDKRGCVNAPDCQRIVPGNGEMCRECLDAVRHNNE